MKYCAQCGREYSDGTSVCPQCGSFLAEAETPPETEPVEASAAVEDAAAPEAPAIAVAVDAPSAVVETPAAEPPPAPARKKNGKLRVEPSVGFFRHLGAFFLTVLLFVFLLVPTVIYEVRDTTTERWIGAFLEKAEVSDYIDTGWLDAGIVNWLYDLAPGAQMRNFIQVDLSASVDSAIGEFIERSTLKPFVAAQAGTFFRDVYAGSSTELLTAADFDALLAENNELFGELMNAQLARLTGTDPAIDFSLSAPQRAALADVLAGMLDDAGARDYLSADGFRGAAPEAYYGMRFGLSWVTFAASLVLAAAMLFLLGKILKSGRRAVNRLGFSLLIIGLCFTLLALFPKVLPDLWLSLFGGEALYALLAEEFFFTHIVFPDLLLLGAGIALIIVVALARAVRRRRLARAV